SVWPGAQAVNAEGVPFEGLAEQNLLLHFWPITVLIFVPQHVEADGSTEFAGFTLAVPEVSNLKRFHRHYPNLLNGLSKNARGYRPADAVIDLAAEGALAFLDHLATVTAAEVEQQQVRYSMSGVEYLHMHKPKGENNTKVMAAGRVAADEHLMAGYHEIVAPNLAAGQPLYRNPLFRRGLLVALLDKLPWYRPFGRTFATFDSDLFIRQARRTTTGGEEKGMPQFANGAAKKFWRESALYSSSLKRNQDMAEPDRAATPRPQAPPPVIVNRVVRNYLLTRTADKTGIKL